MYLYCIIHSFVNEVVNLLILILIIITCTNLNSSYCQTLPRHCQVFRIDAIRRSEEVETLKSLENRTITGIK